MKNIDTTRSGLLGPILISVGLFVFGDKITTVAEIVLRGYDLLVNNGNTQPQYLLEFSFIGLALGISATIVLTSLKKDRDPKEDQTLLIGVITGILAGFLEITKAALSMDQDIQSFSLRAYFYFLIYLLLFIFPIFAFVMRGQTWITNYRKFLLTISKVLLWSCFFGGVVELLIGLLILQTSIIPTTYLVNHAAKVLVFDPIMLVILGALWNTAAFTFFQKNNKSNGIYRIWPFAYSLLAFISGITYFLTFGLGANKPLAFGSLSYTTVAFGLLATSPLIGSMLSQKILRANSFKFYVFKSVGVSFLTTGLIMFIGLSFAITQDLYAKILSSIFMGFAGGMVPIVLYASRFNDSVFVSNFVNNENEKFD